MRRPKLFAVLPTMLTLGNAVCGFASVTYAAQVGLSGPMSSGLSDERCLFLSGLFIFLAMVFDALDGRAARWAKQSSQFGAELDSLCDAISFGLAPGFLLVRFCSLVRSEGEMAFLLPSRLLWAIAVLYMVCAVLRLARFNVETDEEDSHDAFSGLPSPAAAGTVASFMIAYPEIVELNQAANTTGGTFWDELPQFMARNLIPLVKVGLPVITFIVACLMVSRIRYAHVFNQWFRGRRNYQHMLQLVMAAALIFMVRELAVPLIFCGFAFGSPLRALWASVMTRRPHSQPQTPPSVPTETPLS